MLSTEKLESAGLINYRLSWWNFTAKTLQVLIEIGFLVGAFYLAYLLRFDFTVPSSELTKLLLQVPFVVGLQIIALRVFGAHRFIWRYTSTQDARSIGMALGSVSFLLLGVRSIHFAFPSEIVVPVSIIILDLFGAFLAVLGVRMLRREIYERSNRSTTSSSPKKRVILVGAGQAGVMTLSEVKRRGDIDFEVKAFVDDDQAKHGAIINGVKVAGSTADLPELIKKLQIDHVIISIAQARRTEFQKILKICQEIPIKVRTIPGLYELLQGNVTVSRIRDIEIEDLLGREPVEMEPESINQFLHDKSVMVTGAGGSIGSELVRQLVTCQIRKLIMVERSEHALFQIEQEISNKFPSADISVVMADICDSERMENLFARFRPQVVFHAAAHKHVPLMERNASEALKNNVIGTRSVAELAGRHDAEAFVLISSDKAVFPSSVMGATKRLAELVIQDIDKDYSTRFLAVRFGNVIGSNGSVIPTFREQIRRGGPVTVTHPEMTRYFMTIPEATQLVLQAGAIGKGGEILILDMGEPVRILDLARETIRLSGLRPDVDIRIEFVGIRPGEKLAEVLESDAERMEKTVHPKISVGKIASSPRNKMREMLDRIPELCSYEDEAEIREFIARSLPESNLMISSSKRPIARKGNITRTSGAYPAPVTV